MAAMSDYLENKIIDWLLRGQSFSPPATVYIGLFTTTPSDSGGGTEVTTGVTTNYSRPSVTSALANWAGTQAAGSTLASSGTNGTTSNNSVITFPTPASGGGAVNWGTITGIGIYDAPSGGNLLFYGALTSSKSVNAGDPAPVFSAGDLQIQLDN